MNANMGIFKPPFTCNTLNIVELITLYTSLQNCFHWQNIRSVQMFKTLLTSKDECQRCHNVNT